MKTAQQRNEQQTIQVQGFVTDGRLLVSKDGRYVTIYLGDGSKVREHANRIKGVLKEAYTPVAKRETAEMPETLATGFIAQTRLVLSRDKSYLNIFFPGGRFRKHVNYFKAALGIPYTVSAKAPIV